MTPPPHVAQGLLPGLSDWCRLYLLGNDILQSALPHVILAHRANIAVATCPSEPVDADTISFACRGRCKPFENTDWGRTQPFHLTECDPKNHSGKCYDYPLDSLHQSLEHLDEKAFWALGEVGRKVVCRRYPGREVNAMLTLGGFSASQAVAVGTVITDHPRTLHFEAHSVEGCSWMR
jgi:hypothetical protein